MDNHNGVITHLEPDILECEVKWALGNITANKASGMNRGAWWATVNGVAKSRTKLSDFT